MDTIYALATPRGRSGVAVIRISGPDAFDVASSVAGVLPQPGKFALRRIRGADGDLLDEALVLSFRGPASFTGEDVVELHLHGSRATVAAVERELGTSGRLRPAEAGEFTRRALMNDRMDLAQVEGLGDLLNAETEAQRLQAVRLLQGRLGDRAGEWRSLLLRVAALIEATIDFADEEVPEDVGDEVSALLREVTESLAREIDGSHVAERLRDGFTVAILGAPNAGKSTLLNKIAGRDVAITSEIAGTTRDVIEVHLDLSGMPVTLLDTAGLRESSDSIERIGVQRSLERASDADMRIWLRSEDGETLPGLLQEQDIVVIGKADLGSAGETGFGVSGLTGEGIDRLLDAIASVLAERVARIQTATHQRHRSAMERARMALEEGSDALRTRPDSPELAAEAVRTAVRALDSLTGRIDVEAILGEIFSSFCIGK